MDSKPVNVLFAGVGGQGAMLASELLALTAFQEGHDVKQTELHGAAQRGGSVASHVRYGLRVSSPVIACGEADILVSFEKLEALRYAHYLKDNGVVLLNEAEILPAAFGKARPYPREVLQFLLSKNLRVITVPATQKAIELGNPRVASTVILGVLSGHLALKMESWQSVLKKRIPSRLLEINLSAFSVGTALA